MDSPGDCVAGRPLTKFHLARNRAYPPRNGRIGTISCPAHRSFTAITSFLLYGGPAQARGQLSLLARNLPPCAAGRRRPVIPCGRPSRNALCRSRCIWDASKTGLWIPLAIARQSACLQYFVSWEIGYIPLTSDALWTILSPCAILSQGLQLPAFPARRINALAIFPVYRADVPHLQRTCSKQFGGRPAGSPG